MAELNMNESHKVLESNGLYVDDLSRVRVVDPEIADASGKISVKSRIRMFIK